MPKIESVTRIVKHPWVIRVWREETDLQEHYDNADIILALDDMYADLAKNLAEKIMEMPRVSTVEVVDRIKGDGLKICKD